MGTHAAARGKGNGVPARVGCSFAVLHCIPAREAGIITSSMLVGRRANNERSETIVFRSRAAAGNGAATVHSTTAGKSRELVALHGRLAFVGGRRIIGISSEVCRSLSSCAAYRALALDWPRPWQPSLAAVLRWRWKRDSRRRPASCRPATSSNKQHQPPVVQAVARPLMGAHRGLVRTLQVIVTRRARWSRRCAAISAIPHGWRLVAGL